MPQTDIHSLVYNWLITGADPTVGFRLFCEHANPKESVKQMISRDPKKHIQIIRATLSHIAGINKMPREITVSEQTQKPKFRDDYPFLSDPTCPPELKIIVGDKITYYHNYCSAYKKLQSATTDREHLHLVAYLVENFLKNREITDELNYYKEQGKVLGKHQIFEEFKRLKSFRNLPLKELIRLKTNLENNIYRNQKKLRSDNREDLRIKREDKIRQQQIELAEIDRLLDE